MGSMIHLALGPLKIDWGKNDGFTMHGALFQPSDVTQVPYAYVDDAGEPITEWKEGAARPLSTMLPRLELLGFTMEGIGQAYDMSCAAEELNVPPVSFNGISDLFRDLDLDAAAIDYHKNYNFSALLADRIFGPIDSTSHSIELDDPRFDFVRAVDSLHPYALLRMFAENPRNLSRAVTWSFADVVENGWVAREHIIGSLGAQRKFLAVTEGSSDAAILGRALALLRSDVADFFYFVDMEEGYPFTGTGNLHRFSQGLVSIAIENRVLIVYDNDAEGLAKFAETARLRLPPTMRVMHLPDHPSFVSFATVGPEGPGTAPINGRAASIECYLDLRRGRSGPPAVRWTNYTSDGSYQGSLIDKQSYARAFLGLRHRARDYDFSKIESAVDAMISECIGIALADARSW